MKKSHKAKRIEDQTIPARARPLFPSNVAFEYEIVFSVTDSYFIEMKLMPREAYVPAGLLAQMLLLP